MAASLRHTLASSVIVLTTLLGTAAAGAEDSVIELDFGVYSSNKPSAMVRVFKPTLTRLEKSMSRTLGREVDIRMQIARDYDEGIADLASGRVDFSRFGPSSYIEARRENANLRILAMESIERSKVFYGIIAVHADSDVGSLQDLRGRSFAFGDQGSTIGRFLSQLHLEQNGIHAGDLSRYEYLGRHDKVGTAVGAGDFDAGALNEKTFEKLVAAGEPIRELARFSNVTKPWIASSTLDPVVLDALREALLGLDDARALSALKVDGFLEGDDTDYERIRIAMDENDRFFARHDEDPMAPEHLDAILTLQDDENTVRLGVGMPGEVFERLKDSSAGRLVIEFEAIPALGAAGTRASAPANRDDTKAATTSADKPAAIDPPRPDTAPDGQLRPDATTPASR